MLINVQIRNLFILVLAAGIGFVYPLHMVIEHSGLFDQHNDHQIDDHESDESESEDDSCVFCLTLNFTEVSGAVDLVLERTETPDHASKNTIPDTVSITGKSARAPPVILDVNF